MTISPKSLIVTLIKYMKILFETCIIRNFVYSHEKKILITNFVLWIIVNINPNKVVYQGLINFSRYPIGKIAMYSINTIVGT